MKAAMVRFFRSMAGALILLVALTPSVSVASLVSLDFRASGDGALTLDTENGLEWLDLSYTNGIAFKSIAAGWDGLTTIEGFRYATRSEIEALVGLFGILQSSDPLAANYDPVLSFQSFLGITVQGSNFASTNGYYALGPLFQSYIGPQYAIASYYAWSRSIGDAAAGPITVACVFANCYEAGLADYGSFLVRAARTEYQVPEPNAFVLVLAALVVSSVGARTSKGRGAGAIA